MKLNRRAALMAAAATALLPKQLLAQGKTEWAGIKAAGKVRAGAVEAKPWFTQDFASGDWKGLVPDILEAVFAPEGISVDYIDTQWGTAVAGLQSGRFDLMGAYNSTPERAEAIDFTKAIGGLRLTILTLKDNAASFANWDAIDSPDVKLAVIDGSGAARILQPKLTKTTWVATPSSDTMFLELESGRVDAIVTSDAQVADYIASRDRGTMVIPEPVERQPTNIGLRKSEDHELLDWLDTRIAALEADGTMDKIWAKYTSVEGSTKS
ncbi:transporter substrate-binding domain-containing protein (plasmid) [Thioclava sp. 'Guangxiensis']|uniref:transporter substrate-binding domain-containing protein n=1 Tax=Thioclava sp. 'Guangxiensis' TaxID=3149044 RepID=UPI0032C43CA3